jgi:hypothetical protein
LRWQRFSALRQALPVDGLFEAAERREDIARDYDRRAEAIETALDMLGDGGGVRER